MVLRLLPQTLIFCLLSPLISGFIQKLKNNLRMRRGYPLLQPYYNIVKLMRKSEVSSCHTSWIFSAAPFALLLSALAAVMLLPLVPIPFYPADLLSVMFILSAGRFFFALAGLDSASSFSGMGSSRDMFLSALAEPAAILSIMMVGMRNGTTDPAVSVGMHSLQLSGLLAGASLFMVMLVETSRIPVDNQETHLELTMIHEALCLEYSGQLLAFIEIARHIKQMFFMALIAVVFFPINPVFSGSVFWDVGTGLLLKLLGMACLVAFIEVSLAKMRLFRAVDFLTFSLVLSLLAFLAGMLGV